MITLEERDLLIEVMVNIAKAAVIDFERQQRGDWPEYVTLAVAEAENTLSKMCSDA